MGEPPGWKLGDREMKCRYDGDAAHYRCARSGEYLCLSHCRLEVVAAGITEPVLDVHVRVAGPADRDTIRRFAESFWNETDGDCFGAKYDLLSATGLLGTIEDCVAGVLLYFVEGERANILMLAVYPPYQGSHIARKLLESVETVAVQSGLRQLVVATSNDDLPALYLYQRLGFCLSELVAGAVLRHHGRAESGFAGIPVRDEIRLCKVLTPGEASGAAATKRGDS